MLDADIKIIRQAEDARYDEAYQRRSQIRIEYKVGPHGPFTTRIDLDKFSADARDAALNEFARQVRTP